MADYDVNLHTQTQMGRNTIIFNDYTNGALTAGTNKREWIVPFYCNVVDVVVDSETVGVGANNTIIDVNRNGITIFTDQNLRPTLRSGDTGHWRWGVDGILVFPEYEDVQLIPGDVLSYDVDQIQSTSGVLRTKIFILCEEA